MHDKEPQAAPQRLDAGALGQRPLRYFDFVMAGFVTILLLSNVIGAAKPTYVTLFGEQIVYGAGILFFPIGYVIGDVLTEVYGYARARRVIWAGFAAVLFMALMSWVVVSLPPAPGWGGQEAYERVFGQVPRIVLASVCAFWAGEFVNSFVMAKMKLWTDGRWLWTRTIAKPTTTGAAEGLESVSVASPPAGPGSSVTFRLTLTGDVTAPERTPPPGHATRGGTVTVGGSAANRRRRTPQKSAANADSRRSILCLVASLLGLPPFHTLSLACTTADGYARGDPAAGLATQWRPPGAGGMRTTL